jgi:exonuclease SbcC
VKLHHLKGTNFRSFAEFDLDLNASGLFSITGPNGAGKSSIFGAVEWALFGGKRGPGAQRVLRQDADGGECRVELEFEIAGRTLRVERIDGKDAWLTDVATGQQIARGLTDTSNEVAVQLGLTQDMFSGTFYARQKEVQALSSSKSLSERRDQLERLLGIEHLRRAADIAAHDAREQQALVGVLRTEAPDIDEFRAQVERCEREAQESAPAIGRLEAEVTRLETQLNDATSRIDLLTAQITEHSKRRLAAEQAGGELAREQTILDGLRQRLAAAQTARAELAQLEPVAAHTDELTAREREMELRRRNHEQTEVLRAQERRALEELAKATDTLNELGEKPDSEDAAAKLATTQQQLNELGEDLRAASAIRQQTEEQLRGATDAHQRAKVAADIETELLTLSDAEARIATTRERREELRGQKAEAEAHVAHDTKHRDALVGAGDTDIAECPTCHQPLVGTLGDLVADYEQKIEGHRARLAALSSAIKDLDAEETRDKKAAERGAQLRAQRQTLGGTGGVEALLDAVTTATGQARKAATAEHQLDIAYQQLAATIPDLKTAVAQAAEMAGRRADAHERKTRAADQVATYAEQLRQNAGNGYDPAAHAELQSNLTRTHEAVRRCAVLRENADSLQLFAGRIETQQPLVDGLNAKVQQLRAQVTEVEVGDDAHEQAVADRDRLTEELKQARSDLDAGKQKILLESQSVAAARTRLADGQKLVKRVDGERRDLELRAAVATALSDYREHHSRQARPTLEQDASNLLKQVTGGTYPIIRLTESYLLQIADAGQLHPLKRFSGGEQDLASLCLRLALSRTLAHQRGVETRFVILDEVFGSQDYERRRQLIGQLAELVRSEFQQIFVISHTDDIYEYCDLHIKVTREDGVSRAEGPIR